jgi:hypothetical protein
MKMSALAVCIALLVHSASWAQTKPDPTKGTKAASGPGTQTEDELYIGVRRSSNSATSGTNTTQGNTGVTQGGVRPSAGTSPNTGAVQRAGAKSKSTGDEDLDELEVERRKVQGVEKPGTSTVQPRPSAGTSPNVTRQAPAAGPAPSPKPYFK